MDIIEVNEWPVNREFYMNVARGSVLGHHAVHVFGYNPTVSTTLATVWDGNTSTYGYPSSASVMTVSSGSANDTASGSGARLVYIAGLDAGYNEISEIVTLNGQTGVSTTNSYLRISRADVVTAGSGGTAAGIIYVGSGTITAGVPAVRYAQINVGYDSTLMGMYTVPAGHTAYILRGGISTGTSVSNKFVTAKLLTRPLSGVFNTMAVTILNGAQSDYDFCVPLRITEKTDIEVRAFSSGDTFSVSSYFQIVCMKND